MAPPGVFARLRAFFIQFFSVYNVPEADYFQICNKISPYCFNRSGFRIFAHMQNAQKVSRARAL
jgi:hypothetical protein